MPPDADDPWDPAAYDDDHAFVYEYGERVVDLLDPAPGERVLDIGCGTGHLTDRIASAGAEAVGLDASAAMIERARETYPHRFVHADARAFAVDEPFDAVFSNAALHWIDESDQDAVLDAISHALRPGGRFVAELGGTGNVAAILDAVRAAAADRGYVLESPWYFPSVGEYATRLEAAGFEVRSATLFDRPTELDSGDDGLAAWLDTFGDELLASLPAAERAALVADVEDRLRDDLFADGTWTADYRRLRVVAILP
jgi:trans-aconitate methyltransferase